MLWKQNKACYKQTHYNHCTANQHPWDHCSYGDQNRALNYFLTPEIDSKEIPQAAEFAGVIKTESPIKFYVNTTQQVPLAHCRIAGLKHSIES
jgi:hypothetical protein